MLSVALQQTRYMTKPISWFEIPATDFDRARTFYETVFSVTLNCADMGPMKLGVFPYDQETQTGGCIQAGPGLVPASTGVIIYLDASPSVDELLLRVPAAGGSVALEKTALPPGMGCFAHIIDSEGNRVGVHSL